MVLVAGLVAASAATPAHALEPSYAIHDYGLDFWTDEDGLPHNSVTALLRTQDGYLWIGTRGGVARFDGVNFHVVDRRHDGMDGDLVSALVETSEGELLAGLYETGITRLAPGPVQSLRVGKDGLPDDLVSSLLHRRNDEVWIGTASGAARIEKNRIIAVAGGRLDGVQIRTLAETKDGAVWAGAREGLYRWRDGRLTRFTTSDGLPHQAVNTLFAHGDKLYIGTQAGLTCLDGGRWRTWDASDGLGSAQVTAVTADRSGTLWIGTQQGLHRFKDERIERAPGELGTRSVSSILADDEGGLWIGTRNGLYKLSDVPFVTRGRGDGLSNEFVYSVSQGSGGVWVATLGGGVTRLNNDGTVVNFGPADGLPDRALRAVLEDRYGRVWACSQAPGVFRLEEGRWMRAHRDAWCRSILALGDGRVLFTGHGEAYFADAEGSVQPLGGDVPGTMVWGALERANGDIWLASKGLGVLVREPGGSIRPLTTKGPLATAHVMSLHEDGKGNVWAGTYGRGLAWVTPAGKIHMVDHTDGLPQTSIFQVLSDDLGKLWMATNRGVFAVDAKAVQARPAGGDRLAGRLFGPKAGLANRECNGGNQPSAVRLQDGRLAFPTIEGLAFVAPAHVVADSRPPRVHVEKVSVDGVEIDIRDGARLPPSVGRVEFQFTATTLTRSEDLQFKYKLDGFDDQWVDAGNGRTAEYTGLPAGQFVFRVIAANSDGVWNHDGASLMTVREPLLQERPLFWIFVGLLVLAAALGLYRLRVRQLHSRREDLENLIAVRTAELELANARLARLTVIDDLTKISNLRGFRERLEHELPRTARAGAQLGIVICDIDWFKPYNDTYGHVRGNECLAAVASALAREIRVEVDLVARYGGEEFAALLVEADLDGATLVGERFRRAVRKLAIPHSGSPEGVVTLSVGVTITDGHEDLDALIARADVALYRAKENGRDRVETAPALQ